MLVGGGLWRWKLCGSGSGSSRLARHGACLARSSAYGSHTHRLLPAGDARRAGCLRLVPDTLGLNIPLHFSISAYLLTRRHRLHHISFSLPTAPNTAIVIMNL